MPRKAKPLTVEQTAKRDKLIADNAKHPDIIQHLVGKMNADTRAVFRYLTENKTLQSMLNLITRRAKEILSAASEAERKTIVKDIETMAKNGIKMLQKKAGQ